MIGAIIGVALGSIAIVLIKSLPLEIQGSSGILIGVLVACLLRPLPGSEG